MSTLHVVTNLLEIAGLFSVACASRFKAHRGVFVRGIDRRADTPIGR